MFSTVEQLKRRTGKNKVGRYAFLKQLTEEFRTTVNTEATHQVLANLANFSYDPINYGYLRSLGVLDIFLEQLTENDLTLIKFALGGICNLAVDVENKAYICNNGGITLISRCLEESECVSTIIYAINTLIFLISFKHKSEITNDSNVKKMLELVNHIDKRVQNLATIFLEDYCDREQVHRIRNSVQNIPLPSLE